MFKVVTKMHYMNYELKPWAAAILDELCKHTKLDGGGFMPLYVEKLSDKRIRIAHYLESKGRQIPDPEMVFVRTSAGDWLAVSIRHSIGPTFEAFALDHSEEPVGVRHKEALSQRKFAHLWLANIVRQQDLKLPVPEEGEE